MLKRLFYIVMYYGFGCIAFSQQDYTFTYTSKGNMGNFIMGVSIIEKFDTPSMKQHIIGKISEVEKSRSSLFKFCGLYFYRILDEVEWEKQTNMIFQENFEITTEQQLVDFALKEQQINDFSFDMVQYRCIMIPDYQPDKSAFLLKIHHSFSDGLGLAGVLLGISDDYNPNHLPKIQPLNLCFKIVLYIFAPLLILRQAIYTAFILKKDENSIKND
mmetsp:Transcript_7309/g.12362  ORF Transcript_7309/g.12362 Transcript_7309/m.12362 type:complete len:216 (-) Transcript_7309:806-1453(-)